MSGALFIILLFALFAFWLYGHYNSHQRLKKEVQPFIDMVHILRPSCKIISIGKNDVPYAAMKFSKHKSLNFIIECENYYLNTLPLILRESAVKDEQLARDPFYNELKNTFDETFITRTKRDEIISMYRRNGIIANEEGKTTYFDNSGKPLKRTVTIDLSKAEHNPFSKEDYLKKVKIKITQRHYSEKVYEDYVIINQINSFEIKEALAIMLKTYKASSVYKRLAETYETAPV